MTVYKVMKVSGKTSPTKTAGSMAAHIKHALRLAPDTVNFGEMRAVGASAVNQSVKAIAICNTMITNLGFQVIAKPVFKDKLVDGEIRSIICLYVNKE